MALIEKRDKHGRVVGYKLKPTADMYRTAIAFSRRRKYYRTTRAFILGEKTISDSTWSTWNRIHTKKSLDNEDVSVNHFSLWFYDMVENCNEGLMEAVFAKLIDRAFNDNCKESLFKLCDKFRITAPQRIQVERRVVFSDLKDLPHITEEEWHARARKALDGKLALEHKGKVPVHDGVSGGELGNPGAGDQPAETGSVEVPDPLGTDGKHKITH